MISEAACMTGEATCMISEATEKDRDDLRAQS